MPVGNERSKGITVKV